MAGDDGNASQSERSLTKSLTRNQKKLVTNEQMKKQTQYRISFAELDNVNGDMRRVNYSTKWTDSLDEIKKSRWLKCDDAKIVSREFVKETMPAMAD